MAKIKRMKSYLFHLQDAGANYNVSPSNPNTHRTLTNASDVDLPPEVFVGKRRRLPFNLPMEHLIRMKKYKAGGKGS